MKNILFCLQTMVLGGVEKELITILKKMPPEQYDVSLLLFYISDNDIIEQIPKHVKIINLDIDSNYYCSSLINLCKNRIKHRHFVEATTLAVKRALGLGTAHSNIDISQIPSINQTFDIAVCYHMHSPLSLRYVAERIKATRKIVWIHNDFFSTHFPVNRLTKYLNCYHDIVAVSTQVKKEFLELCPQYKKCVHTCHNIIDEEEINLKSQEIVCDAFFEESSIKILTVGRFDTQKGFDLAIQAASLLKRDNISFKWYFVGSGHQEALYQQQILDNNVQDTVVILGRKNNPYPYIKNCDIYVQPSRHEAYAMVILEAKALNKPIICSNFAGAEEQLVHNQTGLIIPVGNVELLAATIKNLINNPQMRAQLSNNLYQSSNDNDWLKIKNFFD